MVNALDFETVPFAPGRMAPPPVCMTWMDDGEPQISRWDEARAVVGRLLRSGEPIAIANAAYDMGVICAHYPEYIHDVFQAYADGRIKDVLIRQKLMDLAIGQYRHHGPYSLKGLVKRHFGIELDKDGSPRMDYERLRNVPLKDWPKEHIDYALDDVDWHYKVYEAQQELLEEDDALNVVADENRQARAAWALHLASTWGIRTDPEGVEALKQASLARQKEIEPELVEQGLLEWNKKKEMWGKKVRIAQARMVEISGGWDKIKLTKTGRAKKKAKDEWQQIKYVAVDAEACLDSGDDLLLKYTEHAQLTGLLSGHVAAMEKGTRLPIHTWFEVLLETGRTSSSKPNIQNVRRAEGARECFVPRKGNVFIGCDYDKAELHTLAQCCIDLFGRSKLGEALNDDYDPHTGLGATLAGVTYEAALEALAAKDPDMKEWRQRAKPANFGFPGGMGPPGMVAYAKTAYNVILKPAESEKLYEGWQTQWPVVQEYLCWVRQQLDETGVATIVHFQSKRYRGLIPYTVAANSFFQGRAADGAKRAMFEIARRQYTEPSSALYGTRTVNFVHDEFILEAPEDNRLTERAHELRDVMVKEFTHFVPDVPVRATPAAMDRWSKNAETLYKNGELQVWRYAA